MALDKFAFVVGQRFDNAVFVKVMGAEIQYFARSAFGELNVVAYAREF